MSSGVSKKEKFYAKSQAEMSGSFGRSLLSDRIPRNERNIMLVEGGEILSLGQLKKISEHQGRHVGQSMMEPLMQPLWKRIAEWIPGWCSPNVIILSGLIFHGITFFLLLYHCQDARSEAPNGVYYLCAFGLAAFFVLDGIDERQAQKTRCHAALRELFQHACHAVSNMFLVMGACIATKLGSHPTLMMFEVFSMLFIFYSVHWQAYCSGIINFQYIDSMEIQFIVLLLYLLTGLFGPGVWDVEVLGCPMKFLPATISLVIGYFCCLGRLSIIVIQGGVGKNGSTIAGTSILSPLVPAGIPLLIGYWMASNSQSHVLQRHPVLFLVSLGTPLIKLSCKIVVSHMTRSEMTLFDDIIYIPAFAYILQKLNWLDDYWILLICLIISLYYLVWYCFQVCNDVCSYLKISCFKVQCPPNNIPNQQQHSMALT